jgi:hypothetical protein
MGVLKFICPAGPVEAGSFERLPSSVPLHCPHCLAAHALGSVKAWFEDEEDVD